MAFAPIGISNTSTVGAPRSTSQIRDNGSPVSGDQVSLQGGGPGASERVSALSSGFDDNYGDGPPPRDGNSDECPPDDRGAQPGGGDKSKQSVGTPGNGPDEKMAASGQSGASGGEDQKMEGAGPT